MTVKPRFVVSIVLTKAAEFHNLEVALFVAEGRATNEDEARGKSIDVAMQKYRNFQVSNVIVTPIKDDR